MIRFLQKDFVGVFVRHYFPLGTENSDNVSRFPKCFIAPIDHNCTAVSIFINKIGTYQVLCVRRVNALHDAAHHLVGLSQ